MIQITAGMTGAQFLAALNTIRREYNVMEYGAIPNSGVDETAHIQAAINAVWAAGGGVIYFPKGVYLISGALQRNVDGGLDPKSQLYIPKPATFDTRTSITLRGEFVPHFTLAAGINVGIAKTPNIGTVLRSTIENNVEDAFVIGSIGDTNLYGSFNYTQVVIEDLCIQTTVDASSQVTIGGIGMKHGGQNIMRRLTIGPYNIKGTDTALPINNCTGIALAGVFSEQLNTISECIVSTFVNGYYLGDHASIDNSWAWVCLNAYVFGMNKLIARGGKIEAQWCANIIVVIDDNASGDPRSLYVGCLNVENTADGYWYDKVAHVVDAANLGRGEIHYDLNEDVRPGFVKVGGTGIMCSPIAVGKVTSGTDAGATNFTITGARDESEGALKNLITKLCAKFGFVDGTTAS